MSSVVALLLAASLAAPIAVKAKPVRVIAASETTLEVEVRVKPPTLDGPHAPVSQTRVIAFARTSAEAPWTVERGLADREVVGEAMLQGVDSMPLDAVQPLGPAIDAAEGDSVTVIDLIEGDVALCVWSGTDVRAVYFADPLIPRAAAAPASSANRRLPDLARKHDGRGEQIARGAIIAAQSSTVSVARFARSCASTAAVVFRDGVPVARTEISRALIDYAQPGVPAKDDAQFSLYFGLARVFASTGPVRAD